MNQFHGDQKLIQLATALPTATVGPVRPNAAIAADVSGFALALGALMPKIAVPSAAPQGKPADPAILLPGRQDVAEGGKELPDAVLGVEGRNEEQAGTDSDSDDADASTGDAPPPPFAWFATAQAPTAEPEAKAEATPAVAVEGGAEHRARTGTALPELPVAETVDAQVKQTGAQAPVPQAATSAAPEIRPQVSAATATAPILSVADAPVPASAAAAPATAAPAPPAAPVDPVMQAAMADAVTTTDVAATDSAEPLPHAPRELRQAAADAPVVRITIDRPPLAQKLSIADVAPGVSPAAVASPSVADQIFAAFDRPRGQAGASMAGDPQSALSPLAAPATGAQTVSAVAATGQAQDALLDTRHQEWTAKMIDKIEMLQGGPVRAAKISLMPEGLGKVDIAIRQEDAGLHVQFSTDTPSARQLIADAQPKLAEIAQERGIRIGSTSVDTNAAGGNGGGTGSGAASSQMNQGQRDNAQPQRNQPSAPLPGRRREASPSTSQDERVA